MEKCKEILNKLLNLPLWLTAVLVVISAAGLTAVFAKGLETHPIAYAIYVISFYSLTVLCVACVTTLPGRFRAMKEKIRSTSFGGRYMTDVAFKTHVSLYRSLAINLLYVCVNLVSGILYKTVWFTILAGYYMILAVMRFLLLRYIQKNSIGDDLIGELKRSRLCAVILTSVNLSLSGAVLMMMYQDKGYEYSGMLIYVMAAYTFYITTSAVINLVKYQKYRSPVMSTAKVISLAAALVSMLSLETAMLSQFGADNTPEFRRIMIAATGAGVSAVVIALSVCMIVRASREIRKIRSNQ